MMIFILPFLILVVVFAFKRYVPVFGVFAVLDHKIDEDIFLLDLRDYQSAFNKPIPESTNIPYAYLKRYYKEIPQKKLLILASDSTEKNLAIRFLLKRKFQIFGFKILDAKRGEGQWSIISKQKIV
jgi:rhodanese-related sulfurtransferase